MRQRIRLTEGDLHRIVKESVKRALREGDGRFTQLYYDREAPHEDESIVKQLQSEIDGIREYLKELEDKLNAELDRGEEAFNDYAYDKYGLTKDNLDKNWANFCAGEHNRRLKSAPPSYPEGGTGYYG
ncbi:MAG: hypothetical protein ILA06_04240 [Bacteroidaceae bacterium]|nr:hypothetical protein [Bacteroidaceae bacterium]